MDMQRKHRDQQIHTYLWTLMSFHENPCLSIHGCQWIYSMDAHWHTWISMDVTCGNRCISADPRISNIFGHGCSWMPMNFNINFVPHGCQHLFMDLHGICEYRWISTFFHGGPMGSNRALAPTYPTPKTFCVGAINKYIWSFYKHKRWEIISRPNSSKCHGIWSRGKWLLDFLASGFITGWSQILLYRPRQHEDEFLFLDTSITPQKLTSKNRN